MFSTRERQPIAAQVGTSRTAHLQPLIDFLKAQGNQPAGRDAFTFDRDGYGDYRFMDPLNIDALRAQFEFPATLLLNRNSVQDTRHFVGIGQHTAQGPPIILD